LLARTQLPNPTTRPAHLYPEVLRRCFTRISAEFGVPIDEDDERATFAATPHQWPAYADNHTGLTALQARAKIGALSNIDNASLKSSCRNLDFRFDVVVTAERVGAYKPDWPHFHTGIADLAALGIPREWILHAGQSLRADVHTSKQTLPEMRVDQPAWSTARPFRIGCS
jgi:2-haloacid dehalogenase